jgi:hypothetical protein
MATACAAAPGKSALRHQHGHGQRWGGAILARHGRLDQWGQHHVDAVRLLQPLRQVPFQRLPMHGGKKGAIGAEQVGKPGDVRQIGFGPFGRAARLRQCHGQLPGDVVDHAAHLGNHRIAEHFAFFLQHQVAQDRRRAVQSGRRLRQARRQPGVVIGRKGRGVGHARGSRFHWLASG